MYTDPLIGKKLGDYKILSMLGRGGMSRVYRGYDENLDRFAAVKVISGDFATTSEEEYTRRFQIEARAIARLRHPNIVGVYQFGRIEGIYYMAMVFLEGKDLRQLLKEYSDRNHRIPYPETLRIVRDVAGALDYAHEQGVIHRDIKPSNIMLERQSGRAILMDFGLALSVHEGTTGDTFGSAHYIAPEQAVSSAKAVPQSDLYSLGVVLYETLAGKVPFDDPSAMSVALKHLNDTPPPLSLYNPDVPPQVEAVVMRMLDKNPGRRYATGAQVIFALEEAFDRAGLLRPSQLATAPSILTMLDSQPSPPAVFDLPPEGPPSDRIPQPTPLVAPGSIGGTQPEPAGSGVAGRFARRRALKEQEEALRSGDDEALQIDSATLDSILESYADPRELGIVGPDASPSQLARASRAAQAARPARRRRTPFLLLLLLIAVGAAAVFYLTQPDDDQDDNGLVGSAGQTATHVAAALLGTEDVTTPAARVTGTRSALAAATAEATEEPSEEVAVVETEAAESATDEPTPTLRQTSSPEPTGTAPPTDTPRATTASETPGASTASPAVSATPIAAQTGASPEPNLLLSYSPEQFLLINLSDQELDVRSLVFERELPNGEQHSFEMSLMDQISSIHLETMAPAGCFQVLISTATRVLPDDTGCEILLGWYRANIPSRYFWLAEEPGATFQVRDTATNTLLETCTVEAGACRFYLPQP